MTRDAKTPAAPPPPDPNAARRIEKRVQSQDPRACVDDGDTTGKSPDQQRRESRLEVARPKDSGRCGA